MSDILTILDEIDCDDPVNEKAVASTLRILMQKDKLVALNYKLLTEIANQRNFIKKSKIEYESSQDMLVKMQLANEEHFHFKLLKEINSNETFIRKFKIQNEILQNMVVKSQMVNQEIHQSIIDAEKLKGGFCHECWF